MRHIVVTQNITLDGIVDNTLSWFDPTADTQQGRELAAITAEHAAASDGFLVGRTTFEEMRGFWPQQVDDKTGVTDHLNRVAKYVVSRTLDDPGWAGTTILRGGNRLTQEIEKNLPRRMAWTLCSPGASRSVTISSARISLMKFDSSSICSFWVTVGACFRRDGMSQNLGLWKSGDSAEASFCFAIFCAISCANSRRPQPSHDVAAAPLRRYVT